MGDALIANPPLCLAGDFSKLADGRQVQCDLQTALAVKMCYVALSDVLTSVQMVEHFERLFICLLYTSPSPRDKRQSRMPSSA